MKVLSIFIPKEKAQNILLLKTVCIMEKKASNQCTTYNHQNRVCTSTSDEDGENDENDDEK